MANSSTFPTTIDSFTFKTEIQASDVPAITRFQELKLKSSRTTSEETELANLTTQLRSKLIAADEWNKFSDALVNMEQFIDTEITDYVTTKQTEINATKDNALIAIEQKKENIITYMDATTAGAIRNDMGDLADLTTTTHASLVAAINENKTSISSALGTANTDVKELKAVLLETDTRSTLNTYTSGKLTKVEEKNGATVVKTTDITYDGVTGKVTTVAEIANGKTVTTTFVYDGDGNLSTTSKVVT